MQGPVNLPTLRRELRALLALAIPVILSELGWVAMGIVDTIMVGRLSPAALGAVGIARTFAYGGHKGHVLHDPEQSPVLHASAEGYYATQATAINHFYEKLLLLSERMNTGTGRRIAQGRHAFLEQFLARFLAEWEGRDGE